MTKANKIKVCFVLPSLKAGGAERVMSFIAQNIDKSKYEPMMVIFGFKKDMAYDVTGIRLIFLNKTKISNGFLSIIKLFRKEKPHIVIGSIGHVNAMLSLISIFFKKIKFIGREANVASVRNKINTKKNNIFSFIYKRRLRVLDVIICQSKDMLNDILDNNKNLDTSKFITLNNPITDGFKLKDKPSDKSKARYITVGAIHERKGHKRLLDLLAKVDHDFEYTIIGNGPILDEIKTKIKALKLSNKVIHIPFTKEVPEYLRNNDLFLNGSYVEGFPNVMIESCATGTPVITFEAPGGINEIIQNGINGYIVTSEEQYVNILNKNNKNRIFNPQKVNNSVTSRYSKEIIISKYEALFENLISNNPIK